MQGYAHMQGVNTLRNDSDTFRFSALTIIEHVQRNPVLELLPNQVVSYQRGPNTPSRMRSLVGPLDRIKDTRPCPSHSCDLDPVDLSLGSISLFPPAFSRTTEATSWIENHSL